MFQLPSLPTAGKETGLAPKYVHSADEGGNLFPLGIDKPVLGSCHFGHKVWLLVFGMPPILHAFFHFEYKENYFVPGVRQAPVPSIVVFFPLECFEFCLCHFIQSMK